MTGTIDAISCAYLECTFDFCRSRSIHLQRIVKGTPYPLERLTDQTQTITWNTFFDLVAQTGKFFDEDDLREIGKQKTFGPSPTRPSMPFLPWDGTTKLLQPTRLPVPLLATRARACRHEHHRPYAEVSGKFKLRHPERPSSISLTGSQFS